MAEFVTKKENQRRLYIVIGCIVIDTFALLVGIYAMVSADKIEKGEGNNKSHVAYRAQIKTEKEDANKLWEAYASYSQPIGWRNTGLRTTDRFGATGVSGPQLTNFLDRWVDQLGKYDIKGYKVSNQEGAGDVLTLTKLFDLLAAKEADLRSKISGLKAEETSLKAADDTARAGINTTEQADLTEINTKRDEYTRLLRDLSTKEKAHAKELDGDGTPNDRGLAGEVYDKQTALTEHRNNVVRVKAQLAQIKKDLDMRINWLTYREAEAEERKEPDGEILAVYPEESIAYIDLIHADRVFRGGRFNVYSLEKGGVKVDKGYIEIIEVGKENYSRVAVYNKNPEDPIKRADKIYNKYYERGKTRNIAIAGRLTGKVSNEEAIKLIKEFGDSYQDKVDERTNYVIVGEGYDDSLNYKLAEEWGVKILLERSFYDYLGIP